MPSQSSVALAVRRDTSDETPNEPASCRKRAVVLLDRIAAPRARCRAADNLRRRRPAQRSSGAGEVAAVPARCSTCWLVRPWCGAPVRRGGTRSALPFDIDDGSHPASWQRLGRKCQHLAVRPTFARLQHVRFHSSRSLRIRVALMAPTPSIAPMFYTLSSSTAPRVPAKRRLPRSSSTGLSCRGSSPACMCSWSASNRSARNLARPGKRSSARGASSAFSTRMAGTRCLRRFAAHKVQ